MIQQQARYYLFLYVQSYGMKKIEYLFEWSVTEID